LHVECVLCVNGLVESIDSIESSSFFLTLISSFSFRSLISTCCECIAAKTLLDG
jgi:hypothetical protein